MSLKSFHTLFLLIAILFDFGYFAFIHYKASPELQEMAGLTGVYSGIFGICLLIYLPLHIRKTRKILA